MFFEATYVPSPQLSASSTVDDLSSPLFSPSLEPTTTTDEPEAQNSGPVDHVIFVIHGIGQQTEQYGQFYEHIENLRETTRQVLQAKVPDHAVRIELIPIEWHRHIHEQTDPTMNKITLKSIPTIRLIENEYLADILYYFSKERGQSIIDNVTGLFNTSYHNFLEKHPDFHGKIAIIGYSLGGIITWDILSHQRQPASPEEEADYNKLDIKYPKLDFKPDYFFSFGSPLGAVLTIRNQSPIYYHPDHDIVFENVFHPFDPLAYRFEPLINDYYTDQPAVLVDRSIPLGPSFSLPSLPSIPISSASLFSFFSWRSSQQQQEEEAAQQNSKFMSSFSSLFQYFSSSKEKEGPKSEPGIVTWDPVRDEARRQVLEQQRQEHRPVMRMRSRTFGTLQDLKQDSNQTPQKAKRSQQQPQHHLVEVLGIDGVRMDMLEQLQQQWSPLLAKQQQQQQQHENVPPDEMAKADIAKETTRTSTGSDEDDKSEAEAAKQQKTLPGNRRIDHVLQPESFMSMIANEYLVGMRAHFSYWTNKDLLWHIVRKLENLNDT